MTVTTDLSAPEQPDSAPARPSKLRTSIRDVTQNRTFRFVLITIAVAAFGYYVPQWAWGWDMPAGELVWGFIIGSLTALMAFGLALIYKANKVINFAQADLGAVPASLCVSLISLELWSFWIALPVALIAAVALGAFVEFVIIRRFSKAPRLILMVVTVGLAQLLAGLGVAIPFFMGADLPQQTYNPPFDFSFEISPVIFHANDLIAVIATLLSIVGLFAFLRFTSIGIALRASSESSDRASLLGVNVGFTHNIAWIIATLLATISLILRAGIIGLPLGSAFGPAILLRALTAAVIGRMENFTAIFLASCGLGAVETIVVWNKGSAELVDPIMFVIVIAALLLQRRNKESRVEDQAISSWQNAANVRPIPRELMRLPEVKWTLRALRVLFVVFLFTLPFMLSEKDTNLAAAVAIYAIIAISLVILVGWAGEISLGQVAFVAIGAAAAGAANVHWQLDPFLSFLLAGAVGAIASIIIGLPALRIRGLFLAVTTLAFAVATSSFLLNRDQSLLGIKFDYLPDDLFDRVTRFPQWTPFGHIGIGDGGANPERDFYFVAVFALLLVLVTVRGLQRSRNVRDLIATRENERNAQAFRLSPTPRPTARVRALWFLRLVRGRRARAPPAGARQRHLRPGREHPRAHDGGGGRARLGARRHPRRRLPEEHGVVRGGGAPALQIPLPVRRERDRAHRRAVVAPRRPRVGAVPRARHVAAPSRAPPQPGGAVAHRRHRRRSRAPHGQGEARGRGGDERRQAQAARSEVPGPVPGASGARRRLLHLSRPRPERREAEPPQPAVGRRRVRPGAGALRREPRAAPRRDDRAARHQRRRQVDGAARDLRSGRAQTRQHQPRGHRHQRHGPAHDRPEGRHPGAGRAGVSSRR